MASDWWIPDQKRYKPGATLYCDICEEIVTVEANPRWEAAGRPLSGLRPAPEWFIRCSQCHSRFIQASEYECPECGVFVPEDGSTLVRMGKAYPSGIPWDAHGHSWTETHKCHICGTEYSFRNADY